MKRRPDLIVPIRDRRQGKRYLTLRNFGKFALAAFVVFAAVSIYSELRHGTISDGYGRLMGKQVSRQEEIKPRYDVVKEAPVPDQTAADPLLVQSAAREQILGVTPENTPTAAPPVTTASAVPPPVIPPQSLDQPRGRGVAIVGDSNGVTIVKSAGRGPVLSGGSFRQQP